MTNADVARAFNEIADLLEIKGEDAFRVNSYRRVARTLEDLAENINDIAAGGDLNSLPGVGKGSAERIRELLETGRIQMREELLEHVPGTLLDLLQIQSLGPKKVATLWRECGVETVGDLKTAIDDGRVGQLKGFGPKSVEQILRGIEFRRRSAGRIRLGTASLVAGVVREAVRALPGVERVEVAGSLRRGCETVGDLDLLCIAEDGAAVCEQFCALPDVKQVLAQGPTKGSALIEYRPGRTVQVDLRVVPGASFGAAWQYFTGSKEHNVRLRERAVKRGWKLSEYGLTDGEQVVAAATEEEIYAALELPWIPPELREDRGEFEPGGVPADLITGEDICGDLHMHTPASDGHSSVAELAAAARRLGYDYICITDHSQSSAIANGLSVERLEQHIADVRAAAAGIHGLTVFMGAEVDILADGRLDYPDDVLARLDFVIASIHSGMGQDIAANTRRTVAAMQNPYVNCIAHPTGRLINERPAMALDIEVVAREAARTGTALEINANTYRLDLKDTHARYARDVGAMLVISTDAHATEQFGQMRFGLLTARRAGLRGDDLLNARDAEGVREFVATKRGGLVT